MNLSGIWERLLGVPPSEPGQGTAWAFETSFPWPAWAWWLFLPLAIAVVIRVYRMDAAHLSRRVRGMLVSLRLLSLACVLFFLSGATLTLEHTSLPYLLLLLDVSRSMETPDQYNTPEMRQRVEELMQGLPASETASGKSASRLALAKALLTRSDGQFLARLCASHKLRIYQFADEVQRVGDGDILTAADVPSILPSLSGLKTSGQQTRPGPALRRVVDEFRGTPPTAVILLSDGVATEEGSRITKVAEAIRSRGVPLLNVGIGNDAPLRDLALSDTVVEEVAFVDDPLPFSTRLRASGDLSGTATVTLRSEPGNTILTQREVPLTNGQESIKVELTHVPHAEGEYDFVLEVAPAEREFRLDNNRERRHVSVRKEKIRVLLVDSTPRYEYRYLKHLLERDRTVELSTILQDADSEFAKEDKTALPHFPVRKEDLFRYDVIIIGDIQLDQLSGNTVPQLRQFVADHGGGLVLIAGTQNNPMRYRGTPLEVLLPFEANSITVPDPSQPLTQSLQPQLTAEGRHSSALFRFHENEAESQSIWDHLPGTFWNVRVGKLKPGAVPFAELPALETGGKSTPWIVMQRFGAGKILFHATDETWRWRYRVGDQYFGRYWGQAMRYLSRSRLLGKDRQAELVLDRAEYEVGDTVQLRVRFLDDRVIPADDKGVQVRIEKEGSPPRTVTLRKLSNAASVFEGETTQLGVGDYRAVITAPVIAQGTTSRDFRVVAPVRETQQLRMDVEELQRGAELTSGKFYRLTEVDRLPQEIPKGHPVTVRNEAPIPLWNHWLPLLLYIGALTAEWILRKRTRLS